MAKILTVTANSNNDPVTLADTEKVEVLTRLFKHFSLSELSVIEKEIAEKYTSYNMDAHHPSTSQ